MKICVFEPCEVGQFGGGYCKRHQYMRTDKPNKHQNKPVEPRSTIRPYKRTTPDKSDLKTTKNELLFSFGFNNQKEMFDFVWNTREHICQISGSNLDLVPKSKFFWMFAHILNKKNYPFFKLNAENILLVHPDVHYCVDNFSQDMRQKNPTFDFNKWFGLLEEQKQKYKDFLILNQI